MSDSEEEFASADEGEKTVTAAAAKPTTADNSSSKAKTLADEDSGAKGENSIKSKHGTSGQSEDKGSSKVKGKNSKQKRKANKNKKDVKQEKTETDKTDDNGKDKHGESVTAEVPVPDDLSKEIETKKVEAESDLKSNPVTLSKSGNDTSDSPELDIKGKVDSKDTGLSEDKKEEVSVETGVLDQTIDREVLSGGDNSIASDTESPQKQPSSSWGGWSSWGTSLVSAATSSVSTFTNQVGEGFTTVLETVETTLGAPPPEELVRNEEESSDQPKLGEEKSEVKVKPDSTAEDKNVEKSQTEDVREDESSSGGARGGGWLSGWGVSSLTHLVSDTGKTLVTGSLDVLETIGKKTYDALSDHDPGVKAAIKGSNKPNLSSVLRDAKDKAAEESRLEEEFAESRQAQFGAMFDEYQGLAHLEALEMLSNQSENRVQALLATGSPDNMGILKTKLINLKEAFELEEIDDDDDDIEHDFAKLITDHLSQFHKATSPAKLHAVQAKVSGWFTNFSTSEEGTTPDPKEIHKVSIQSLAELTAKTVEQYHKAGELLLLQNDQGKDMLDRAKALGSVTRVVCTEVGILSSKFTKCLNKIAEELEDSESVNTYITNIYLEASNSSTYVQDAFQLLLPVLQQATIEEMQTDS